MEEQDLADHRSNVYWDSDIERYVYRASALGNCQRSLVMARAGLEGGETPEFMKSAFKVGQRLEDVIIKRFCAQEGYATVEGLKLLQWGNTGVNGQVEVEMNVGSKAVVRCHPDGVVQKYRSGEGDVDSNGDVRVLEVKALGIGFYNTYRTKGIAGIPFNDWQWACEMAGTGLKGAYVIGVKCGQCKGKGVIPSAVKVSSGPMKGRILPPFSPCQASGCEDGITTLYVRYYDTPTHTKSEIIRRVWQLERLGAEFDAGEKVVCDWKMFPCPYYTTHDQLSGVWENEEKAGDEGLPDETLRDLKAYVIEYRKAEKQWTYWGGKKEKAAGEIKKIMADGGMTEFKGAGGLTYVEYERKGNVDVGKLEEDGVEVDKYRKSGSLVRTVKVEREKEENG